MPVYRYGDRTCLLRFYRSWNVTSGSAIDRLSARLNR